MTKDRIFKKIIESNEEILRDERKFQQEIKRSFSSESELSNALILLYQLEIMADIEARTVLDNSLYYEFLDSLTGNYGIKKKIAQNAIYLWFVDYGQELLGKVVKVDDFTNEQDSGSQIDVKKLIGMRVMNLHSHSIGVIQSIQDGKLTVDYHGTISKYTYPAAFAGTLELEDEEIYKKINSAARGSSFEEFKSSFKSAINFEIAYLKATGGKKYWIVDGEKLPSKTGDYLYAFDTDTELHFLDGTAIKLWFPENIVTAYVVSCEDFTILIRSTEYIGETIESVEFTSEQWQLLDALVERLGEMNPDKNSIAYDLACNGKKQIVQWQSIKCGRNQAYNRGTTEKITFIWGPPGTGKTETLANIALEHMARGRRVLMLSYSNVSVDGALLRVSKQAGLSERKIIRYGYPRTKELLESKTLTSYQYVLHKNPREAAEYQKLIEKKKKLKRKDPERVEVNKKLNKIREFLLGEEKELIKESDFVATTVSKATVDKAIYCQRFDVVIFDEASMAYVPQIVFSAGLAKSFFVCLGDFCQLPAIVQNNMDDRLSRDIFDYTGITTAVNNRQGHNWLVMLDLQYRMHRDISDFVSENMYWGHLKTSERIEESREEIAACHPCPGAAMSMLDIGGMYSVCTKTMDGSRINVLSALICMRLAEKSIEKYEVGIITPYSAQSRLLLSMIRDMQEHDERWFKVSCATVHQFQGSEKPVIIYDAVDCFRMSYPGMLLTSLKNDTANRLFNVAITRAKGKFILVANHDYLERKHISQKLMFTKAMSHIKREGTCIEGDIILDEMMPEEGEVPYVYIEDRMSSWEKFLEDVQAAMRRIHIDVPDLIDDDDEAIKALTSILVKKKEEGVDICIRLPENVDLPEGMQEFIQNYPYVTNPVTLIDNTIIWFGHPLYAADFISEGEILDTLYFPCIRFKGIHASRSLQAFLAM